MSVTPPPHSSDSDFNPFGPDSSSRAESVDIIGLIQRSQRTVLFGLLCGLLLGILAYLLLGPTYEASTKLLVSLQASISDSDTGDRTFGDRGGHIELLKSDEILKRAVEDHNLGELETLSDVPDLVEAVADRVTVRRSSGDDRAYSNVFELAYESRNSRDAAAVLDAIVAAYKSYLDESRLESTGQIMGAVTGSENQLKREIDELEQEYLKFRKSTPLHWSGPVGATAGGQPTQSNYFMTRLNTIENDRLATETEIASTRARMEALQSMQDRGESPEALEFFVLSTIAQPAAAGAAGGSGGGGGAGGAGQSGGSPGASAKSALTTALIEAFITRVRLLENYDQGSEEIQKADKKIQAIADLYKAEGLTPPNIEAIKAGDPVERPNLVQVYIASLRLKLTELSERKAELEKLYADAQAKAREAAVYELQDTQFAERLDVKRSAWKAAVTQAGKLDMVKDQKGYAAKQITPTRVELAIKRIIKIVGAAGAIGMLCTLFLIYIGEMRNASLRTPEDVARLTQTPVFGTVPHFEASPASVREGSDLHPTLRYFHQPGSREAEAFRSVRTALFHSDLLRGGRGAVVQVMSPEPGDGKSTVAANLAAAIAQAGHRVLLIDVDLRRSQVHALFGVAGQRGLTDVLTGELGWQHAVVGSGIPRLSLLPAGTPTDMPAELLSNFSIGDLLDTARQEYDYVILDSPPLLAVSDPCIVAPYTDGVMLVVRLDKNQRVHISRSMEVIRAHGMKLLGAIVNDSSAAEDEYYAEYLREARPAASESPRRDPALARAEA